MARTEGERSEVKDWISRAQCIKVGDFLQQHLGARAQAEEGRRLAWCGAGVGQVRPRLEGGAGVLEGQHFK